MMILFQKMKLRYHQGGLNYVATAKCQSFWQKRCQGKRYWGLEFGKLSGLGGKRTDSFINGKSMKDAKGKALP